MKHIILSSNNSSITQSRNLQIAKSQEKDEYDHRQYRYLISIFANNINQMVKGSKDCLGELQFQPKYKVTHQMQDCYESHLTEIYQKYKDKIAKETKYRNASIQKTCSSFLTQYQQAFPPNTKVATPILSSFSIMKKVKHTGKDSLVKSINSQTRKTTSAQSTQDKSEIVCQTLKTFQTEIPSALKFKTVSSDKSEREYFFKSRSALPRNQRTRIKSDSLASKTRISSTLKYSKNQSWKERMSNEILADSRRGYNSTNDEWQSEKEVLHHNKFCTKRVVAIGQSQKKTINDIQVLHLQTNNVCISKAFETLPDSSYTYKAKGKSWLTKDYS